MSNLRLQIHGVSYEELADIVHCFSPVEVEAAAGGFNVTTQWAEANGHGAFWLLRQVEEFERIRNAATHEMRHILTAKRQGRDCTEDESAAIKRYFDTHDPGAEQVAGQLAKEFPVEHAEWHDEFDAGARPTGAKGHSE